MGGWPSVQVLAVVVAALTLPAFCYVYAFQRVTLRLARGVLGATAERHSIAAAQSLATPAWVGLLGWWGNLGILGAEVLLWISIGWGMALGYGAISLAICVVAPLDLLDTHSLRIAGTELRGHLSRAGVLQDRGRLLVIAALLRQLDMEVVGAATPLPDVVEAARVGHGYRACDRTPPAPELVAKLAERPVHLDVQRVRYRGTRFGRLVERHVRRADSAVHAAAFAGTAQLLPFTVRPIADGLVHDWTARLGTPALWRTDLSEVFDEIIADAEGRAAAAGAKPDDETLFNLFQLVVFAAAYAASESRPLRRLASIRRGWLHW